MKLVDRVSVFFLAALGVVLIVYSGVFYAFVRGRLMQQFEEQIYAAFNSLVAAIEVEPEEVKWQPLEHTIALGEDPRSGGVRWVVIGDRRQIVEKSRSASPELITRAKQIASRMATDGKVHKATGGQWRLLYRRLYASAPDRSERQPGDFDELVVVVARSTTRLETELEGLLLLVSTLPLGTWLAAAAAGRWFCRRALRPVWDMSRQASAMTGADFQSRLPVSDTADELAELAVAFNTLLDRQHRAFEQQRRFAGDAAHELRTPLTVLLGEIDVCLRRPRSADEYAATLRLLRSQTCELQKIVESLLFLAGAEEDTVLPDSEMVFLDQWLPEYLRRWSDHPRSSEIQLAIDSRGVLPITASTALLSRLLDNLIENAFKYSGAGSGVQLSVQPDGSGTALAVEDHGCGIAVEDQSVVFEPFFRSREARHAGIAGSGLGLAIAARIARAMGGRLSCSSQVDRGSRFTLWLPSASLAG